MKKKTILSLLTLAMTCLIGGGAVTAISASAEETANTPQTVAFQMEFGASVRVGDEVTQNGIRYQITMPVEEHAALEANDAYSSVSYGILIAPSDYEFKYGELTEANVFGTKAKYDWAVKNSTTGKWEYAGTNGKNEGDPVRIMNLQTAALTEWEKDTTKATFFGSITNVNAANLPRDYIGVGYIKYTVAGGATGYVFADRNDNVRSMSQVARAAYTDTANNDLDETQEAALKKTYVDDVYGDTFNFDKNVDTYLIKRRSESLLTAEERVASIVEDAQCEDGKAVQAKFINQTSNELIVDVGGEYQFKDIEKIVIRYKITAAKNASDSWWRLFLNDNVTEGQQVVKGTGVTFSDETGRGGGTMSNFATMTIEPSVAITKTGLTKNDYFTKINFGYRYGAENVSAHGATILIDSIKIVEKVNHLEFNSEDAISAVVMEGYQTSIVDLENGNKALQADLCQWYSGGTRGNLKINLGGQYQVKDVAKVEISYRVFAVTTTSSAMYWNIHLNASGSYTSVDYNNRLTGIGATTFVATSGFNTITLTDAGAAGSSLTGNTIGGTLLNQDSYLENLFFCVNGSGDANIATIQIDYIRITLKA